MIFADNHQQSYAKGSGQDTQEIEANTVKTAVLLSYAIAKKLMELAEKYAEKNGKFKIPSFAKDEQKTPDISLEKDGISQELHQLEGIDTELPKLNSQESNLPKKEPQTIVKGSFTYGEWSEIRDEKKEIPNDYQNAMNIANTAYKIAHRYGKSEGKNLVAEGKDYRITIDNYKANEEIAPEISVISKENNQPILEVKHYIYNALSEEKDERFNYQFSAQDVKNFKKIAQELERDLDQELEP